MCPQGDPTYPQGDSNPHIPSRQLQDMPDVLAVIEKIKQAHASATRRAKAEDYAHLRPETREVIYLASLHLYWPLVRLTEQMDPPPIPPVRKAILRELRDGKYANTKDVRIGRKTMCLIELRDAAWQLLGTKPQKSQGRGFLKHRTFANWIAMVGRKRGYEAVCEWVVSGTRHAADAAWHVNGAWETFEVVDTCDQNLSEHVQATFAPDSPVSKMTVVAAQKSELRQLEGYLASLWNKPPGRIEFVPIEAFEQELWPS